MAGWHFAQANRYVPIYKPYPPYRDLDLEGLSEGNSRRQDAVSIYADIDGFTDYVADRIANDASAKDVGKALHILRGELDVVLHEHFAGRKIRFIGDCVHGVLIEGTAQTTDAPLENVKNKATMEGFAAVTGAFNFNGKIIA